MTILQAMADPQLFGPLFAGDSWAPWKAFLACLFGLPLEEGQQALRSAHQVFLDRTFAQRGRWCNGRRVCRVATDARRSCAR